MLFVKSLENELLAYRKRFEDLREATPSERETLLSQPIIPKGSHDDNGRGTSPCDTTLAATDAPSHEEHLSDTETELVPEEIAVGSGGHLNFYGRTSLYYTDTASQVQRSDDDTQGSTRHASTTLSLSEVTGNQALITSSFGDITPSLRNELLDVYWCWPHHLHCVLSKKVFIRKFILPSFSVLSNSLPFPY